MWALGDKVASSIVAQSADIPTLPWSGSGDAPVPTVSVYIYVVHAVLRTLTEDSLMWFIFKFIFVHFT